MEINFLQEGRIVLKFTKMTIGMVMTGLVATPAPAPAAGPAEQTELFDVSHQARKFCIPRGEMDTPEPPDDVCDDKIIQSLNKKFGRGFNNDQIVERILPNAANGTYHIVIKAENLPQKAFNRIHPGRFTVDNNFFTRAIFPVGPTLHIEGKKKGKFSKINTGKATTVNFLVHLDQGNPLPGEFLNPVGATVHGLVNVVLPTLGVKENPCP